MIKVVRREPPKYYFSPEFLEVRDELLKIRQKEAYRRQDKSPLRTLGSRMPQKFRFQLTKEFKEKLSVDFNNKCAYCETKTEGEIDHFRPQSSARGFEGDFSYPHYWWLSYEWENQYYSCSVCNRNKGSWFPVYSERAEMGTTFPKIFKEKNLLIDPCNDNPAEHFSYSESGIIEPLSERAKVTIDILKLNRKQLVEFRKDAYLDQLRILRQQENKLRTDRRLDERSEEIMSGISKLEHLGIRRFAITNWLQNKSRKKKGRPRAFKSYSVGNSYIGNVEIKNFRKLRNLKFEVSDQAALKKLAPWTVILGENGVGKSSILQAIGLALVPKDYLKSLINTNPRILNDKSISGSVILKLDSGDMPCTINFNNTHKDVETNFSKPINNIIGFGSTRLYKQEGILRTESARQNFRIGNLYKHHIALENPEEWLLKMKGKIFESAGRIILKALGFDGKWRMIRKKNRIYIAEGTKHDLLETMSDGYKSTISLIANIMAALSSSTKGFDEITGIVLIDEMELHLHPRWKMRFIKSFRSAFPNIQVFATTHDPLCLKGLLDGEVVLLEGKSGRVKCRTDLPSVYGLKAEQLLTSEFFGLSSTIDPEDENDFSRYYFLLGKSVLTQKQQADLDELKLKVLSKRQLGDSLREELMLFAADEVIAKEYLTGRKLKREDLKDATAEILRNILKKD